MAANAPPGLAADGLTKSYGGAPAIADLSVGAAPGELVVLVGPSGCGKSTLAYLLAGYISPDSGTIALNGHNVAGQPGTDRLMVFQETALWPWMKIGNAVAFGPQVRGEMAPATARREADGLLQKFGLGDFTERYPGQLSGGMKRRAELAQALINRPEALILDEPFRGLDVMTRELMQEHFLRAVEGSRIATLFITAEIEEAVLLGDRALVMQPDGHGIASELTIDLARPRRLDQVGSERFAELRTQLLDSVMATAGAAG